MENEKEMQGTEAAAECTHDCSTCSANCGSKKQSMFEAINPMSMVGKVIGIVSGKGGVGKSMVTSLLTVQMNRREYKTAILDADAFEAFRESGDLYNPELAKKFRFLLSHGNTIDPMKMYVDFRGKQPSVEPLKRNRGLI